MPSTVGGRRFGFASLASLLVSVIVASNAAPNGAVAAIGPRDRRLTNLALGISVEAPAGWTLSQHTGYRDTVVLLLHPDGSRITVTAAATPAPSASELLRTNMRGFSSSGLQVLSQSTGARGALMIDLASKAASNRGERLRQAYLVRDVPGGRQAIVLTLVCRESVFASRTPALDFVLTRMSLDEPTPPAGSPVQPGASPADGSSGGRTRGAGGNGNSPTQQPDQR